MGAPAVTGGAQFEDVRADDYFAAAVAWAAANGVTQGADEIHFAPDGRCTRAQMVSFLYRARSLFDALLSGPDELPLAVPRIYISTRAGNGTALQKEDDYVNAVITVTDVDGSRQTAPIRVKVRGHSTAHTWVEKKAYTFKYDKKQSLLDLGKGKKWALLANTFDPTLLRNDMANAIARELGLAHTSNHRYVELWMDGSFRGCYDLFEPVQVNKEHVNLDLEGNDGKKDFMLELEVSRMEAGVRYLTAGGIRFAITEPEDATGEQSRYIRQTMETVFDALRNDSSRVVRSAAESSSSSAADMRLTSSSSSWMRLARSRPASLRMAVASAVPAATLLPSRAVMSMYRSALVSTSSLRMTMPLAGPPRVTSAITASAVTVVSRRERTA